jgi:uncharacterized protein
VASHALPGQGVLELERDLLRAADDKEVVGHRRRIGRDGRRAVTGQESLLAFATAVRRISPPSQLGQVRLTLGLQRPLALRPRHRQARGVQEVALLPRQAPRVLGGPVLERARVLGCGIRGARRRLRLVDRVLPSHTSGIDSWYGSLTAVSTSRDVTRVPVEMLIRGLGQVGPSGAPLVLLKEATGERHLAIGIGPLELMGIAAALSETPPPRPLTHDLLCRALAACGATVTRAVIHALVGGAFHARLTLDVQGRPAELDARSSDAIAVAVRVGIPILVEDAVLEQAGITPQAEAGAAEAPADQAGRERIGEDQLGAFRDVIRGLDLDDLGRPGPSS